MPAFVHDCLIRLIQSHRVVVRELCRFARIRRPRLDSICEVHRDELSLDYGFASDVRNLRPDLVLQEWTDLRTKHPDWLLLLEVQRTRDLTRAIAWASNMLLAIQFFKCDAPTLLAITLTRYTEQWCKMQIEQLRTLHGILEHAHVIGPSRFPFCYPPDPHVAALVAVMLGKRAPEPVVRHAVTKLLNNPDIQREDLDYVRMVLISTHTSIAEEIMMDLQQYNDDPMVRESFLWEYSHERGLEEGLERGREQGLEQGREQALRDAIHALLRDRGLPTSERLDERLAACHDPERLTAALCQSARVDHADQLLDALTP